MASDDTVRQIVGKLATARKRVPGIKGAIQAKQSKAEADKGRKALAALDKDLEESAKLARTLTASPAPPPDPDPEPGPDPVPPTIPGPYPGPIPNPPDPSKVISGKTYSGGALTDGAFLKLAGQKNFVYTKNKFINSGRRIVDGDAGRGVLLTDNFIDNLSIEHDAHCIFPGTNWQTSDDIYELFCVGLQFGTHNNLDDEFEIKGSKVYVIGCQGPFSVRIRHGVGSVVMNNPECWNVSVRCGPHFVGNMPGCKVILYSGNLDGRQGHWEPDSGAPDVHDPGGGHNLQCAVETSVVGVKEVVHGFSFGANDKQYVPTGCIIDPSLQGKTKVIAGKPTFQPVTAPQFRAVQALERIRSRMVRDVAEAHKDERHREHEVYEWFLEANVNALRQAGTVV